VYQKNGDFGLPPASSPANFSVTPTSPIYGATVGGNSTVINAYTATTNTGGSCGQCAAKLTNGNIVIVYRDYLGSNYPVFKIVDANNTVVVAQTTVSTTVLPSGNNGPIGVIALTGGGFVVHYPNGSSNKIAFGIFTNTGAVTTATAIDTTYPSTIAAGQPLFGCALPNGGFAITAAATGLTNVYMRSFSSTGVGAYSWVTVGTYPSNPPPIGLAARSDSSVCVLYNNGTTNFIYTVYNSGGGSIATGNITITGALNWQASVACLANDTFVLGFGFIANSTSPRFCLLPTGNVLGAVTTVPTTGVLNTSCNATSWNVLVKDLSAGGFVYFFSDGSGAWYYMFYSATGVAVYAAPKLCPPINIFGTPYTFGVTEITGYLSLYHMGAYLTSGTRQFINLYNSKISLTDYNLLGSVTTTSTVGTTSAASGAYARSTSLPMKAAYLAANTETLSLNQVVSTGSNYLVSPSAVNSNPVIAIKSATLPDGRFVIAYQDTSYVVSFNVYSITGVLQTTVVVGTGFTTARRLRITALPSGKIAVAYLTASTTVTLALYSSAFAFINSTVVTSTSIASGLFDVAGLSTDRVAIIYQNAAEALLWAVYSNTLTLVTDSGGAYKTGTTFSSLSAMASNDGGFWSHSVNSGTSPVNTVFYFANHTANAYTPVMSTNTSSGTVDTGSTCSLAVNYSGMATTVSAASVSTAYFTTYSSNDSNSLLQTASAATFTTANFSNGNAAVGTTGAGTFLYLGSGNANGNFYAFTGVNGTTAASTLRGTLSGVTVSATYGMQACITPSYGYNAVIAWIDVSNTAQYAIIVAAPFFQTQAVTAGVTGSVPTVPLNISQSSGYYLAGVAVSDCPAGGTGQIQTNGVANLNSQYSTTTAFQGFDFQNPVTVGVKGTAVGRTVTMIKD